MKRPITFFFRRAKEICHWQILDGYILKKYLGTLVYSIALLMTIVIVFDISENIQHFLDKDVSLTDIILKYYLNFIPYFVNLFIPLFTFISVIWFTSKLSSQNEIISILNGGVSFNRMLVPYIVGAVIIGVVSLMLSTFIVPKTQEDFLAFKDSMSNRKYFATQTVLHLRNSNDSYIYLERWEEEPRRGYMFTYEQFSADGMKYKLSAQEVSYNDSIQKWELKDYTKRSFHHNHEQILTGVKMDTVFNILPQDFDQDVKIIETMTLFQLNHYIKQEESKGSSLVKYYIMEKHKRLANPLGTVIMTLLGQSIASRKTRRGLGVHLFFGIALAFSFIFLQQISTVFSLQGGLPPWLGSWIPNLIYIVICGVLLKFAQK